MKNTSLAPHTEPTVFDFLDTAANLIHRADRALSVRGISFSEFRILRTLAQADKTGCARIDLAAAVGLTPSAVTRALKPLEKLGYVASARNERDARQSLAVLTPAGLQLFNESRGVLHDLLRTLPLNGMSQQKLKELQASLLNLRTP